MRPPTFGMPPSLVVGLIAGGDRALRNPVEFAEDDEERGWEELREPGCEPDTPSDFKPEEGEDAGFKEVSANGA